MGGSDLLESRSPGDAPEPAGPLRRPLVLGVETSCDDTACAVVDGSGRVVSSVVSSQMAAHLPYGGVVPEIASREHLSNWPQVYQRALADAGVDLESIDAVAATSGPGLVGSLLVGLSIGKALAYGRDLPFFGVHHLEGHLFSPFLDPRGAARELPDELIALVVSGGHTALFEVRSLASHSEVRSLASHSEVGSLASRSEVGSLASRSEAPRIVTLGETRDDALGEAFDKIGKRLGLGFPAGPRLDEIAESLAPPARERFRFSTPRCRQPLDFSYSGLKTQALRFVEELEREGAAVDLAVSREPEALELVRAFRAAAVRQLLDRVERCFRERPFSCLAVSGGVAANRLLRRELQLWSRRRDVDLRLVPLAYSGDNAAMIAFAALLRLRRGDRGDDPRATEALSRVPLGPRRESSTRPGPEPGSGAAAP